MVFFSKTRMLVSGIGLTVIGIGVLIYGIILGVSMKMPPVDLYEVDWTTLKTNQHVEFDMDFLADCYMFYERDGRETSRFYAVPDLYVDEEGYVDIGHFMGIGVASSNFDQYDKLSEASYEWWMDETGTVEFGKEVIHVDGYLRKMSANDRKYMTKYLTEDWGYSEADLDQVMTKYVIMTNGSSNSGMILVGAICLAVGLVFLGFAIFRFVKGR
ncbi:MAG: hypothetical protein IKO32_07555 [Lachnospiraceae bacterium]|nr:hypothetical protein [Lachnospiraceae bacterium]